MTRRVRPRSPDARVVRDWSAISAPKPTWSTKIIQHVGSLGGPAARAARPSCTALEPVVHPFPGRRNGAAAAAPSKAALPASIQKRSRSKGYVGSGMRLTVLPEYSASQSMD